MSQVQRFTLLIFCISCFSITAQKYSYSAEIALGQSLPSNKEFPDRELQSQFWFHVSQQKDRPEIKWHQRLQFPETGISLGYSNYGNNEILGSSYSILPFIKFKSFNNNRLHTYLGLGASYFTKKYDVIDNPLNHAISTDVTWTFRAQLNYQLLKTEKWNYSTGLSVVHHSNGHTRLPNNGFNSFLVSINATYLPKEVVLHPESTTSSHIKTSYLSVYQGVGFQVFSDLPYFNRKKEVYTVGAEYGKTYNRTWKLGIGAFYRFYQHYYDYINDGEYLVRENQRFSNMNGKAFSNATNIGVFIKGELLLNYIGIELAIGANLYKPAYKIDYSINEGWDNPPREFPDGWQFADLDTRYKMRHLINSRVGINYYPLGTNDFKNHNFYIGAHINANYGQADFTELRLGYVYEMGR